MNTRRLESRVLIALAIAMCIVVAVQIGGLAWALVSWLMG